MLLHKIPQQRQALPVVWPLYCCKALQQLALTTLKRSLVISRGIAEAKLLHV